MKLMKRAIALLLCFLMLTNGPISAFATESVSDNDVVVETTTTSEEVCEECGGSDAHTETCSLNPINLLNNDTPVVCTVCGAENCETTHVYCDTCAKYDCGLTHTACDKCGTVDCQSTHEAWCDICKKDACGLTHTICDKCGTVDCQSTHEAWCDTCKKDSCGVDHTTPADNNGETVSGSDVGCTECKQTEGHAETCSQYKAPVETCEHCGIELTDGAVHLDTCLSFCTCEPVEGVHQEGCKFYVKTIETCEHCGVELTEEAVHTEECPLYEAPVNVFADLMAADSVEKMYAQILEIVNGDDADLTEALMNLTFDELEELRARVNELDPEGDDADTEDMLDMLSALPNAECPDCGLIGEHEEDCVRNINVFAGTGTAQGTMNGAEFRDARDSSGLVTLTGDTKLTTYTYVNAGESMTIDLNGYALIADFPEDYDYSIIYCDGNLTIKSSNMTREHRGTLSTVDYWIDKRANYSNYGEEYNNSSVYYDRYDWVTTTDNVLWKYDGTGSTIIKGGVITGGVAHTYGGAIRVRNGGVCNLQSGTIAGNAALRKIIYDATREDKLSKSRLVNTFGGAVYIESQGTFNMNGGTICYNWVDYYGAAVCVSGDGSTMNMTSGVITNNFAQGSGGGIGVRDGSTFNLGTDSSVNYSSVAAPVISYNRTYDRNYTGGGAGIEVTAATLNYKVGKISYNHSSGSGAGIYCYRGGSVNASTADSQITNNYAGGSGGAIFLQYGDVNLDGCILNNNESRGSAGAVGIRVGNFTMTGGEIKNNKAGNHGGAVYVTAQNNITPHGDPGYLGGGATITGTLISGNTAGDYGGAVYVSVMNSSADDCDVTLNNCQITNNTAGDQGGAVYLCGGTLTVEGTSTLVQNNTSPEGGAFYVEESDRTSTNLRKNSYIYKVKDSVYESGWELYEPLSEDDVDRITDPDIAIKTAKVYINAGKFEKNRATSGNGGMLYVTGTKAEVHISGGELLENAASGDGGAVYVSGGDVTMTGGTINKNTAVNGAGVYITDGEFEMISGTMTSNVATSHGGGAYVHGGNITIGVNGCDATNTNHSVTHTDLPHPVVSNNDASFGGGLAADGGTINIYCGKIKANTADNAGMGDNVFMYTTDEANKPTLNHINGQVGEEENHGMVVIGGDMNIPYKEGQLKITINYHDNGKDLAFEVWVGEAPDEYYLNLPYCPQDWETTQSGKGLTFVGWTYDTQNEGPDVSDVVDLSFIRDKEDYKALGDPVKIHKVDWKEKDGGYYIDFYAVWAPLSNKVSYEVKLDNYGSAEDQVSEMDSSMQGDNKTSYTFSQTEPDTIVMTNPEIDGYTFTGWKITPSKTTISNWSNESNAVDETEFYGVDDADKQSGTETLATYGYEYKDGQFILTTDRNFGDITLTAVFEEQTAEYTYNLVGPDKAADFGTMTATGASETYSTANANEKYTVTIGKVTGNPGSATAEAKYGFKLKDGSWFTDKEGNTAVNSNWVTDGTLTPDKVNGLYEGGTFYAIIEYHLADLIISKTATGSFAEDQTFIFQIYKGDELLTTVALQNNESVTIKDLTIGTTYTVKEVGGWSWRFDATEKDHTMVPVTDTKSNPNTVAFTNTQNTSLWLTDDAFVLNKRKNN